MDSIIQYYRSQKSQVSILSQRDEKLEKSYHTDTQTRDMGVGSFYNSLIPFYVQLQSNFVYELRHFRTSCHKGHARRIGSIKSQDHHWLPGSNKQTG